MLLSSLTSPSRSRSRKVRDRAPTRHTAPQVRPRDHALSVIDLHCHLIPGIDDGPRDMRTALAMAELQVQAGVTIVAATPHVSWDLSTDAASIREGLDALREAIAAHEIPLRIVSGAEVDVHRAMELSDAELRELTLGGGNWLLLEAPLQQAIPFEPVVESLLDRGMQLLIAHPERSPVLQRDPAAVARLVDAGALTQVTASSFAGRFGRTVQRFAERLVDEGLVHVVASDAHDPVRRPPGMHAPLVTSGLVDLALPLTADIPAAILAGGPIPALPERPPRRRGFRGLLGS